MYKRQPDDRTITIELAYAYASFPALTANAPYMPCKQAFFTETRGKYGLESDSILGNGPFMLRQKSGWVHDKYVRLVANENYCGEQPARPSGVMLTVSKQPENVTEAILGDVIDAAPLPGDQLEQAEDAGLPLVQFADTTWGVCLSLIHISCCIPKFPIIIVFQYSSTVTARPFQQSQPARHGNWRACLLPVGGA